MKTIPLTHGRVALVDDKDYEFIIQWDWGILDQHSKVQYAITRGSGKRYLMHRIILESKDGEITDHINGDGLDNRRSNIRTCTQAQNSMNSVKRKKDATSHYKGVCYLPYKKSVKDAYVASIRVKGKNIRLGRFDVEEDAAREYDRMALKHFGEYARINGV